MKIGGDSSSPTKPHRDGSPSGERERPPTINDSINDEGVELALTHCVPSAPGHALPDLKSSSNCRYPSLFQANYMRPKFEELEELDLGEPSKAASSSSKAAPAMAALKPLPLRRANDRHPPRTQRVALDEFAKALDCQAGALQRDENSDWHILGKLGHIYSIPTDTQPAGLRFEIFVRTRSKTAWTYAKKALAFATIKADGVDEGSFILGRLPSITEAMVIRRLAKIPKHKRYQDNRRPPVRKPRCDA